MLQYVNFILRSFGILQFLENEHAYATNIGIFRVMFNVKE